LCKRASGRSLCGVVRPLPPYKVHSLMTSSELRERLWAGLEWCDHPQAPVGNEPSAWFLAKSPPTRWEVPIVNQALQFALERLLKHH
jgi:hypothetical protein